MKKIIASILILFALFIFASCGGGSQSGSAGIPDPDDLDTSKEYEVTFYHAMGQKNQEVIQSIANKWSAQMLKDYGVKVKVTQTSQGDYVTLRKTIAAAISAGDAPTIAQTYPDHVALYLEGDAVRSLDDYIKHPQYGLEGTEENSYGYLKMFWQEGRTYDKAGTLYSIPFNKSTEVLFYNQEFFAKYNLQVPKTWDDVVEICEFWKTTTEYADCVKKGLNTAGIGIDSEANFFITLIQQWGGEYTGFDAKGNGQYLFDNQITRNALNWLIDQFNKKNIVTTTYFGTNYCSDAFKAQQCPMTIGSSAGASYNVTTDGSFTTGVAAYPQMAGASEDEKYVIQQGTNVTLFKNEKDAQLELLGYLFMKYLTTDGALEWTLGTSYFPITQAVVDSPEYQLYLRQVTVDESGVEHYTYDATHEVCNVGLAQSDYFFTSVAFPGSSQCRDEATLIIQEILYNPQEYSIDKAIKDALAALEND